jgi:hypothetical protein
MNTNFVQKTVHIRPKTKEEQLKYGAVSIVSRLFKNEYNEPELISYAVSFTSPKDQFTKKIGAKIALERIDNDPSRITENNIYCRSLPINNKHYDNDMILMAIVSDILLNIPYPRPARRVLSNKFINNHRNKLYRVNYFDFDY